MRTKNSLERQNSTLGKRRNEKFLECYLALDKVCADKFGVFQNGVTEYISRLGALKMAPHKDDVLSHLVRYRSIRNKFAHESGALRKLDVIEKKDILWIKGFHRDILAKRDPISKNLLRKRKLVDMINHKWLKIFLPLALLILLIGGIAALFAILVK